MCLIFFFPGFIFQLHKTLIQVLFTSFVSQLFVIFYAAWTPHSYFCAPLRISVPLKICALNTWVTTGFFQNECGKPPEVPVGSQRVDMHCVFRVVQHGEKLHLRFQVAYKDNLSVHGSILEAVQIPGSVQVPDSSVRHRRDDGVKVNLNFCEWSRYSQQQTLFLTICTTDSTAMS